jgi:hypothetical protein
MDGAEGVLAHGGVENDGLFAGGDGEEAGNERAIDIARFSFKE